jgi:DNA-directed RNA polymerase sigma subunit (sigma70/sigma32)
MTRPLTPTQRRGQDHDDRPHPPWYRVGLTQDEVAARLGVTRSTIQQTERTALRKLRRGLAELTQEPAP